MSRRAAGLKVEITEGAIRVSKSGRNLTLVPSAPPPSAGDAPDFLIHLDDIQTWDKPHHDEDVEIEDLQRILDAIENECDRHGLRVEFE